MHFSGDAHSCNIGTIGYFKDLRVIKKPLQVTQQPEEKAKDI